MRNTSRHLRALRRQQLSRTYDIAIVGSGFAGSLLAMIARRLGYSVVLLEKNRHPRVVIGESSTPLSNLLLDELSVRYDLPRLKPLTKWGSWQRSYPNLPCGLKRGFSFYHHRLGHSDAPDPNRHNQLLVAASPHDEIADTHWYRADFDQMFLHEAQSLGADYFDEVNLDQFIDGDPEVTLKGKKDGRDVAFRAQFVVDATGPHGFLHRTLRLSEASLPDYPSTEALYSHFSGVKRLAQTQSAGEAPPYPIDDAAVHHVFDGGWIWVLHFNNGITSAGVAATKEAATHLHLADGESAWKQLLSSIPAVKDQFAEAKVEQPFTYRAHLSSLSGAICGKKWAMLPSAAGFVDPLLSTGFPLTLLGIGRLADILERDWNSRNFHPRLQQYAAHTTDELLATSQLIASMYENMNNFQVFTALSLLYFAAASFSETARRLGKPQLAPSFLLHDHELFGPACRSLIEGARHLHSEQDSVRLVEDIFRAIESMDVAGLGNRRRKNWYPVDPEDLLNSAAKMGATRGQVENLLRTSGFYR